MDGGEQLARQSQRLNDRGDLPAFVDGNGEAVSRRQFIDERLHRRDRVVRCIDASRIVGLRCAHLCGCRGVPAIGIPAIIPAVSAPQGCC